MRITLFFLSSPQGPQLEKVIFKCSAYPQPIISHRGIGYSNQCSFKWSYAVQALCLLFTRHRASNIRQEKAYIEGLAGSLAASLDYALSKQPNWMLEMFGTLSSGHSYLHRILERINPERKRPGNVSILVRPTAIAPEDVLLLLDSKSIDDDCVGTFLSQLENSLLFPQTNVSGTDSDRMICCLQNLMGNSQQCTSALSFDKYLVALCQQLSKLESEESNEKLISLVKNQIKRVCIFSEAAFALNVKNDHSFKNTPRFSCSSLIDNGLQSYLEDPEWEYLLYTFGDSFKGMEILPTRIFFVNESVLAFPNFYFMKQIILKHLECGVRISLVNDSSIEQQSRQKRNIAYFGPSAVLHATDQVDWDLSFSFGKNNNSATLDKYEYYRSLSFASFELDQKETLDPMLLEIMPHSTKEISDQSVSKI